MMSGHTDMDTEDLLQTRWSLLSRLKDWGDDASWQEFVDTYRQLIYRVALKSGLTEAEAKDVLQETLVAVAKNIADFKRDPKHGSFKGWLLNTTRWKIADQFRRRLPQAPADNERPQAQEGTATAERVADGASFDLESVWEEDWRQTLMNAALEKVKRKVSPQDVQIFDLCVLRSVPVKEVAGRLQMKLWKVYFAQKRVSKLLKEEIKRLEMAAW
jgi:RNA polymerase sigma-70 factor (ECF subfamily)